jgi:tRNA A-37 threonylcarbamoyl transferase component Bud32
MGEASETSRSEVSPAALADLMIAALLTPGGGVVALDPDGESAIVTLRRGNATTAEMNVAGDVAAGVVGRLARMSGLDPLQERSSLAGSRAARLAVKVGPDSAEVLVTLRATALGMSAELRLLTRGGRPVEQRSVAQLKRCTACGAYQSTMRRRCEVDGGGLRELSDEARLGGTIGPYVLRFLLGEGAMGQVFAAEHALIERSVAIKVLRASMSTEPAIASQFLFEARATSRLRHPNVVEVTDYGVLASGTPFIVMERLVGAPLERRLSSGRALEAPFALRLARAIALGLCAAHDGGVIHNDLKPSNVIELAGSSEEAPRIKLIDFGAATTTGSNYEEMVVGTAAYMAPERICGEASDARSDVYSLGAMIHRMLSGNLPFDATESAAMFLAHMNQTPKPVESPSGALPSRVVRLVSRALAKKRSERYQSMKQMIVDIDDALGRSSTIDWRKWLP